MKQKPMFADYEWSLDGKMRAIHEFVPVAEPQFVGTEEALPYIIWLLYKRTCDALKSFIILAENKCYYDAFIIAGHALETCAVLSYIKDHQDKETQQENYKKYMARSAVGRLIAILEMNDNLNEDIAWETYKVMLGQLHPFGATIIKDQKNTKEKHQEAIEKIKFREGPNSEKIKLLQKYYDKPNIKEYITVFSNNMNNVDKGDFYFYYTKYCSHKHSNMMTPGADIRDIYMDEVDRYAGLMCLTLVYLKSSGLESYVHATPHSSV